MNPSCSNQICNVSPTPKPTNTAAPTNSDGIVSCPYVNMVGFGFPLNVCMGGHNYTLNEAQSIMYKCNETNNGVIRSEWIGNTDCDDSTASSTITISLPSMYSFNCYGTPCDYYMQKIYGNESGSCAQNENSWMEVARVVDKCLGVVPESSAMASHPDAQISIQFTYDCNSDSVSFSSYFGNECQGDPAIYVTSKSKQCYTGQYHKILSNNICNNAQSSSSGSTGTIIGVIIGVCLVLFIGIAVAYYFFVYRKKHSNKVYFDLEEQEQVVNMQNMQQSQGYEGTQHIQNISLAKSDTSNKQIAPTMNTRNDIENWNNWDVQSVAAWIGWIQNGKFKHYQKLFRRQEISGCDLEIIEKRDLQDLGIIKFADRTDIFDIIQKLKN